MDIPCVMYLLLTQAHKLGLISSPSQSLPTAGKGKGNNSVDARNNLRAKPRQLLVMGAKEKDQLITYFEVLQVQTRIEEEEGGEERKVSEEREGEGGTEDVKGERGREES